ncbi:hypothetical protein KRP22_011905 [Phytophthora ramorum]|nr:hypothetical protein KRP22_11743 [Phytophthora ramorum]
MKVIALIATGAAVLASVPAVDGHAYIVDPAAQWADGYPNNGYGSTIDNEIWGVYDNSKYGYGVNGTLNFFKATFPDKGYDSLGAFIAKNQELYSSKTDPDCGLTVYKDSARSELPASKLTYSGFTHTGPCEVCTATTPATPTSGSEETGAEASTAGVGSTEASAAGSEASSAATTPTTVDTEAPATEAPATETSTTATDAPATTVEKCAVRRRN